MTDLALGLIITHFAMTSLMTFRHFNRKEKEPLGATFITVAAVVGTIANGVVWWRLAPAGGTAAVLLIVPAFAIYVLAVRATSGQGFWRAFSSRTPPAVVDTGIYGHLRHPFYVSYMLYWLSWCALNRGHVLSLLIAAGMIGVYVAAALKEERLLTSNFGERYTRYVDVTRMFVPWIV